MSKAKARRELRDKIKAMVDAGEPVPSQLVRLARSQMSLRKVTPQFMAYAHGHFFVLPNGVLRLPQASEVHDLWRPVVNLEPCWSLMPEDDCQAYAAINARVLEDRRAREIGASERATSFATCPQYQAVFGKLKASWESTQ